MRAAPGARPAARPGPHPEPGPAADAETARTLAALPGVLDPRLGMVEELRWHRPPADEPRFRHCHAQVAPRAVPPGRLAAVGAGGTAVEARVALAKAVGEAVERYCVLTEDARPATVAAAAALGDRAVDPRRFALLHPAQLAAPGCPYVAAGADRPIGWAAAWSLTRGAEALVPATEAYLWYKPRTPGDRFDAAPVSGYASGATREAAALRAALEVVERDAFMLFWLQQLPAPGVDLAACRSPRVQEALGAWAGAPARLHAVDITTDFGVPAAAVAATSRAPGWPAAVVATAADLTVERAVARALHELAASVITVRVGLQAPGRLPRRAADIRAMEDHGYWYASPRRRPDLHRLLRPTRVTPPAPGLVAEDARPDAPAALDLVVRRLARADHEVLLVDRTRPEAEALGFHVARVLVPGALPVDFGQAWRHLGARRLYDAPRRMGYAAAARGPDGITRLPHPFP